MSATAPDTPALRAARAFAARGWRPFPVEYAGKRPAVGIKWGTATASAPTEQTLQLWFGRDPVNVGIAAKGSGLVILDDDSGDGMTKLCEAYGQPVPKTYRVATAKGWHWYFRCPDCARISNKPGILAEYGFDVRGGAGADGQGDGGYVVAAGSMHESGIPYGAEDPDAEAVELPAWLVALLLPEDEPERPQSEPGEPDAARCYTADQAAAWIKRYAVDPLIAAPVGGRNNALNTAAVVVGHFVPAFWAEESAVERLTELAQGIGLDSSEIGPTIRSGLRTGMAEPYTLVAADPFASASDTSAVSESDAYEKAVAIELNRLKIADEARRRLTESRRPARLSIAERAVPFARLAEIPAPQMLVERLVPDRAVGFLNGRSGSFKSFVLVALAMGIGTRTPVMGHEEFKVAERGRVLYAAAEGSSGVALRLRAYAAVHGVEDADVILLPGQLNLSSDHDVMELYQYAVDEGCTQVFVDTFRAASVGVKENDSTEVGRVIASGIHARDEHGIGTLYADHTGHAGERAVGAEAKWANVDYALMVRMPDGSRRADQQRILSMEKLKDLETVGEWPIRLRPVPEVCDRDKNPSAAIEVGQVSGPGLFGLGDHPWWLDEVPSEIAGMFAGKSGRHAALDIVRILRHIDDEDGLTKGELATVAKDSGKHHSGSSWRSGLALVKRSGVAIDGRTPEKLVIAPQWIIE